MAFIGRSARVRSEPAPNPLPGVNDTPPARDKTSLDVFWLKDKSLVDLGNLPEPDELAERIIENLEAGLDSFREVLAALR